jgi:hypothetical protein
MTIMPRQRSTWTDDEVHQLIATVVAVIDSGLGVGPVEVVASARGRFWALAEGFRSNDDGRRQFKDLVVRLSQAIEQSDELPRRPVRSRGNVVDLAAWRATARRR